MATQLPKQRKPRLKSHPQTPTSSIQITEHIPRRKKLFGFLSFVDLGCGRFSSSVQPPGSTVSETTRRRRKNKKKKKRKQGRNRGSCPENVCCAPPVVGFTYDVAHSTSADPSSRRHHRQRSRASRQATVDRQQTLNAEHVEDVGLVRSNVSDSRQYNRLPRRSPGGISEIVMIEHNPLLDGRIEGSDRYGAWRINADIMSYEELVELSDRIGYVDGGLQEEEILECLKRPKKSFIKSVDFTSKVKDSKCSICQEECKGDEDLGRLECGHYHHLDCIKQWLLRKNECPICKTVAKPDK
ncbi:putative transcription factor C2H2 family [Helianthus annuus]|nr:putative transcription factor C2H2 family [Helianthus annuus]